MMNPNVIMVAYVSSGNSIGL